MPNDCADGCFWHLQQALVVSLSNNRQMEHETSEITCLLSRLPHFVGFQKLLTQEANLQAKGTTWRLQ